MIPMAIQLEIILMLSPVTQMKAPTLTEMVLVIMQMNSPMMPMKAQI